ncbi:hypothetical protein F4823DRAFT_625585 [Ustulina deusta]|nr:hypothetical protein F4823DRAFT_625585 [Ustulina deusta]
MTFWMSSSKLLANERELHRPPNTDVGVLNLLPLQLLQESFPNSTQAIEFARNPLRGILGIETGRWITCSTLYEKICGLQCENCGDFGGYLYLLTCKPHESHTWHYSPNENKVGECAVLAGYESALGAGIAASPRVDKRHAPICVRQRGPKASSLRCKGDSSAVVRSGSHSSRLRRPPTADPFDGKSGNPFRCVAIARMPYPNNPSHPPLHHRWKFTVASFKYHLAQCGDIKNGKHRLD